MKILETQYGEDFVGRDFEVQDLKRKIRNNGVVVLTGNRGIGKTNLMRVLEEFFKQERKCHYIDSGSLFLEEISRIFLPEKVRTGFSGSIAGTGAGENWNPRNPSLLEYMEKSKEKIIFVENAHELIKEEFQIIIAAAGRNNRLRFVLEIATTIFPDVKSSITSDQIFNLDTLKNEYIEKIVRKESKNFSETVIKNIIYHSSGYPYIARSLAYVCDGKDSESEMLAFLNTLRDKDTENNLDKVHEEVLGTLDESAQEIIKKLALGPQDMTWKVIKAFCGEKIDSPINDIKKRRILREKDEKYRIYHPLFRDYLRKEQKSELENKHKIYSEALKNIKSEFDSIILLFDVINEPDIFKELIEIAENYVALNSIGTQIYVWGKISEAALAWSRILKIATSAKDNKWISFATGNMGNVYQIQGDMKKALEHYEKALKIGEEIGDNNGIANALGNMGIVYQTQGDMKKALEHYESALEIHNEIGGQHGKADQLTNKGVVYRIQGDMKKALEHYESALEIHNEIGDQYGKAADLGNIGVVYGMQGDMKKALEHYEKALEIHDEIGNKQGIANQLTNTGNIYRIQGDLKKALEHYKKALEIHDEIGNKQGMASDLGNIGIVYGMQRELKKAIDFFEKALEIDYEVGNKQGMAKQLTSMGNVYQMQGDMKKALEHHENALKIFKDIGDKLNEAQVLMIIGIFFINKKEKSIALDYLLDAQDITIDYAPYLFEEISNRINGLLENQ